MSKRSRSDIRELEYRMEIERRRRLRQDQQLIEEMKNNYKGCAGNRLHTRRDFLRAGIHIPLGSAILSAPLMMLPKMASAQESICNSGGGGGGPEFISATFFKSRGCNFNGDYVNGEDPNDAAGSRDNLTNTSRLGRDATTFSQFDHTFGVPMYTAAGTRHRGMLTVFQDAGINPSDYVNGFTINGDTNDDTGKNPISAAHILANMTNMPDAYTDVFGTRSNRPGGVDTAIAQGSLDNSLRVSVVQNDRNSNSNFVNLGRVTTEGGNGWGFSKNAATGFLNVIKDITAHDLNLNFKFLDSTMKQFINCGATAAASSLQDPLRPYKLANNSAAPQPGEDNVVTQLLERPLTGTVNATTQDLNQNNVLLYGNLFAMALNGYAKHIGFEEGGRDDHSNTGADIERRSEVDGIMMARFIVAAILKSRADGKRRQGIVIDASDGSAGHNGNPTANGRFGQGSDAGVFGCMIVFAFDTGPGGLGGKQPKTVKFNSGNPSFGAQLGSLRNNGINADAFPELGGNNMAHVPYIVARIVSIWLTGNSNLFKRATANSGSPINSMSDSEFNTKFAVLQPAA